MRLYTPDTTPEAHRQHVANVRAMTPAERVATAFDLSACALDQALAVIQRQQPTLSPMEVRLILLGRLYGPEIVTQVRRCIAVAHK